MPLILSVDDDATNHVVLESFLKAAAMQGEGSTPGYLLKKAMSGQEALDLLNEMPFKPDLILLDVMMPGMSGFEVRYRGMLRAPTTSQSQRRARATPLRRLGKEPPPSCRHLAQRRPSQCDSQTYEQ